jgi:predicted TIM-barrel fold metal-dependent hydrolase
MGKFHVIDADGHVVEPLSIYPKYIEPRWRDLVPTGRPYKMLNVGRPLGMPDATEEVARPSDNPKALPGGDHDPHVRVKDMDNDKIDVAVCFPSLATSLCCLDDVGLEAAMLTAYNRWMADHCAPYPARLKGVMMVTMRDMDLALAEIRRCAKEPWVAAICVSAHMDDKNLDHPFFHPLWREAQEQDLPICVHAGTARPPYPLGTFELSNNFFLLHSMQHPMEQQRAVGSMVGGGVLDMFPRLRVAFLESGCGWVPWFMERLDERFDKLRQHVPFCKKRPREHMMGEQCFFACDPDESSIEPFLKTMGEDRLIYASDYPHWDAKFPGTVDMIADRTTLTDTEKAKVLGANAQRLFTRLA